MENKYKFDQEHHIHLLEGKPLYGTSTVVKVLSKPLTWWASGLAVGVLSGIEDTKVFTKIKNKKATKDEVETVKNSVKQWLGEHKDMSVDDYIKLCDKAYRAHSVKLDDSAKAGTDLHAELERFVKNSMMGSFITPDVEYEERINPFIEWTLKNVDKFLWSEMHSYSEKNWVGGISDVGVKLKNGQIGIIDFKSAKDAYDSHFFQIAGYDIEISENGGFDKDGNKTFTLDKPFNFYMVVPFGAKVVKPIFNSDLGLTVENCRDGFLACLIINKIRKQ